MARAGTALASVSPVEIDCLSSDGEPVAKKLLSTHSTVLRSTHCGAVGAREEV